MAEEVSKPKRKPGPTSDPGSRKLIGQAERTLLHVNLTPEQEAYCRGRAMGMTQVEAAQAAGLTRRGVQEWEKRPHIKARISELAEFATKNAILQTGLDREYVISRLMNVAERCMQAEPVLDKEGSPTGVFRFDSAGANQALKLLGDTLGMFKPQEKRPEDDYANLSDNDIARIVGELASQTGLLLTHDDTPGPA